MKILYLTERELQHLYWVTSAGTHGGTFSNVFGVTVEQATDLMSLLSSVKEGVYTTEQDRELCATRIAKEAMGIGEKKKRKRAA